MGSTSVPHKISLTIAISKIYEGRKRNRVGPRTSKPLLIFRATSFAIAWLELWRRAVKLIVREKRLDSDSDYFVRRSKFEEGDGTDFSSLWRNARANNISLVEKIANVSNNLVVVGKR